MAFSREPCKKVQGRSCSDGSEKRRRVGHDPVPVACTGAYRRKLTFHWLTQHQTKRPGKPQGLQAIIILGNALLRLRSAPRTVAHFPKIIRLNQDFHLAKTATAARPVLSPGNG